MPDQSRQEGDFVIDPKDFISPPYRQCPKCTSGHSFGVLMVCRQHYVCRCKHCWHSEVFSLPALRKHVLYLDQFVISNMMKALNARARADRGGREVDDFWLELFRTIDRLCKLQLLVCPDSEFHSEESLLSPFHQPLKRMYELLSGGVTLYDHKTIQRFQIYEHVQRWARGQDGQPWRFHAADVVRGDLHGWRDSFIVSVNWPHCDEWIEDMRRSRETVHESMLEVFDRWRAERHPFEYWFEEEAQSYGKAVLKDFCRRLRRCHQIVSRQSEPTIGDLFASPAELTVTTIQDGLKETGLADTELLPQTISYLMSDAMQTLPFNRIAAMLYAAMARQAGAGRKKPPGRGVTNDVQLISAYLPYCDAMFVDNECHGYLMDQPLRDQLDYGCRIFCLNTRNELLTHLLDIEASASPDHLATVEQVYGDKWGEPYELLYEEPQA